ncbi:MAG: hypothetical protein LLG44_14535, partial [Chloroflexi bacterium]|nr:hypothetical protein [Chloroflexota bacterium]
TCPLGNRKRHSGASAYVIPTAQPESILLNVIPAYSAGIHPPQRHSGVLSRNPVLRQVLTRRLNI